MATLGRMDAKNEVPIMERHRARVRDDVRLEKGTNLYGEEGWDRLKSQK